MSIPLRRLPLHASEFLKEHGGVARTAALVALATVADYLCWLGWDQTKDLGPDGSLHGPFEPWQIVGLVLVLAVIAAAAGWRRHPRVAVIVTTLVMTVGFSVQGSMDPLNDGLWPIGAFLVAVVTFQGVGLVAFVADRLAGGTPGQTAPGWHPRPWVWVVLPVILLLNLLFWL